ncbi:MAG: hypothetical protein JO250_15025 [Armatimonadetes bacterium]|nr:hypothetical protein [Armatimonadota bacterium]
MILGAFRDEHPRVTLTLPGLGHEFDAEFIVDTGFTGDLALPAHLAEQLDGEFSGLGERRLANGQRLQCRTYEIALDWFAEPRPTEVLVLEGDALLGTVLFREYLL